MHLNSNSKALHFLWIGLMVLWKQLDILNIVVSVAEALLNERISSHHSLMTKLADQ